MAFPVDKARMDEHILRGDRLFSRYSIAINCIYIKIAGFLANLEMSKHSYMQLIWCLLSAIVVR